MTHPLLLGLALLSQSTASVSLGVVTSYPGVDLSAASIWLEFTSSCPAFPGLPATKWREAIPAAPAIAPTLRILSGSQTYTVLDISGLAVSKIPTGFHGAPPLALTLTVNGTISEYSLSVSQAQFLIQASLASLQSYSGIRIPPVGISLPNRAN